VVLKSSNSVDWLPKSENRRFPGMCMAGGNQAPPPLAASGYDHQLCSTIELENEGFS
jgi:hypothetical protein